MSGGRLYSIAPHAPFLQTLAAKVCDGTLAPDWDLTSPFGLCDITIILPTQRARLALAHAFARQLGNAALLPDIRTFGGTPEEEEPFLPPFDAPLPAQPVSAIDRKLILAQLVEAWIRSDAAAGFTGFSDPPSAGEILALAGALGELIDDCHVEQVAPGKLREIAPDNLAANWQAVLRFLDIALEAWPGILAERGLMDAAALRNDTLRRQAEAAPMIFGDRPVIAAGSTGSIPATAALLQTIAGLPRGALVLPGLDTDMPPHTFKALIEGAQSHGHPQYGIAQLLRRLGAAPDAVTELAGPAGHPRTRLIRQALALAEDITGWADARTETAAELDTALAGLAIAVARTDEEQARAIALAAHDALTRQHSVGIISPDRNLARRVAAELKRFGVTVDDSAGVPLFQTRAGRLARQAVAVVCNRFAPVDLMALLRSQRVALGRDRAEVVRAARLMEFAVLRGQRPAPGLAGLRALVAANLAGDLPFAQRLTPEDADLIMSVLTALEQALAPLADLLGQPVFRANPLARALGDALGRLTADETGPAAAGSADERALADWLTGLGATASAGPGLNAAGIEMSLQQLMSGVSVRMPDTSAAAISIWGHLEARLQNPDLVILAGMSEGVWPEAADPGPWMSRGMRMAAGLEPPERRQGQAAHDFEMAMGNAEVLITRAERSGTSPAVPSRLLQRIAAFAGEDAARELEARGHTWVARARDLDYAGEPDPASRPAPRPPVALRPKSLSVTEVETLVRSPYDLYAKYVLGLRKHDPLGDDPDARERGTLIHDILGRFVADGHDVTAPDAHGTLMRLAEEVYAALEAVPERRVLWLRRFADIAHGFLAHERARDADVAARHAELYGRWTFPLAGENFTLRGRADRIDVLGDGTLEIIDFKTGAVPAPGDMKDYSAPQLLLEAAMARQGVFTEVPAAPASALTYIKLGHGPEAFAPSTFRQPDEVTLEDAVDEVVRRLQLQAQAYLFTENLPMAARIYPDPRQRFAGDYDHLARTGEWTVVDGGEEG